MKFRLTVLSGDNEGSSFNLPAGMVRIGSSNLNEIILKEKGVTSFHAQIKTENNKYIISNLGSPSGIIINGEKTNEAEIKQGDIIELGEAKLKLEKAGGGDVKPARPSASVETQKKEKKKTELFNLWEAAPKGWRIVLIISFLIFIFLLFYIINLWLRLSS
jgi:pSer/pThr/pTyr-binding forkhead associated (FHA) protein